MATQQKILERFWCVKQIHIFRALAVADANALARITTFKQLKHGESLSAEGVYLLQEGRVKIYETPPEGETITLEVLEPGEIFGAVPWEDNDKMQRDITAETLTEVVVGIVTVKNFQFFLKRKSHLAIPFQKTLRQRVQKYIRRGKGKETGENLMRRTPEGNRKYRDALSPFFNVSTPPSSPFSTMEGTGFTNPLLNIAFRSPASRLALLLQHLADAPSRHRTAIGRGVQCTLRKLSTKKMAQLIGSSVEKTEALLKQFNQHNVLEKRYRRIRILDVWQLKKIANARMETLPPKTVKSQEKNETYEQNEPLFATRPADGR